ncbi:HAD-IA family hydrolase [Chitinophaga horti]|uniref:HAD-IA family hydrolase n=1 Tax=Chitinophaga horti TaxID=2920382 RepID=A0ABY6J8T2_9BACT|nr:HAD-IA family hydrolase [Chitinophaga horti]UYQ94569.1 HAD-IA family hydrolase [Chitinophaga horti]
MNKPACFIFDCDGVLVDSETIGIRVLLDMTAEYGVAMDFEEAVGEFSGRRLRDVLSVLQTQAASPFPTDFEQSFRKQSYEVFQSEVLPVEGIRELLTSLKVPFCVASSGPVEKIKLNLSLTGLLPFFTDRIYSGYDINSWKPDPGIFLYAAKEMGFAPAECIVVEDSKAGVQAGIAGGFSVFGYAKHSDPVALKAEGAQVFYSMFDLPGLIGMK